MVFLFEELLRWTIIQNHWGVTPSNWRFLKKACEQISTANGMTFLIFYRLYAIAGGGYFSDCVTFIIFQNLISHYFSP
jgi:hypothetical protein